MLRSITLAATAVVMAACANVTPATTPTPGPTSASTATAAPSATIAPTTPATPAATATLVPTGGPVVEVCGTDWFSTPASCGGEIGERFAFQCPPGGQATAIYGTDTYTDDSSACVSAVHAGLISFATGGSVTLELRAGLESYVASTRNGVESSSWGSWPVAFVFVGGAVAVPTDSPFGTPSPELAPLLAHVPAAFNVNCHEVTTLSAGEVIAAQCTPDIVSGYITYILFDSEDAVQDKWFGDLDYFGDGAEGPDCATGPCLVAWERAGFVEGRYFANYYTGIDPNGLIAYWFDSGLMIEVGLVVYDTTFAELYDLALQAGPVP